MDVKKLFSVNRKSSRINETLSKKFGMRLNLESFNLQQLEDARNKLRTQLSQIRSQSGFNENLENEAFLKAQFMLDAINAEIAERDEHIIEADVEESKMKDLNQDVEEYLAYMSDVFNDREEYDLANELHNLSFELDKIGVGGVMKELKQLTYWGDPLAKGVYKEFSKKFGKFAEGFDEDVEEGQTDVDYELHQIAASDDEEELIDAMEGLKGAELQIALEDMMTELKDELAAKGMNDVMRDEDKMIELLMDKVIEEYGEDGEEYDYGPMDSSDDADALKSAGFGSDEDYGDFGRDESIQGETMKKVTEGEVQQASAIVTAKTMVDRVGRWIEELSGMENETLLQLGDSIRDEMGQEQARAFIEQVAPAIQSALETLKSTRETLSTGVNTLATGEAPADMLGAEPAPEAGAEGDMEGPAVGADMEMPAEEPVADEFAAAEPAAGGAEAAGREQRESVNYQNRLIKVLAG